MSWTALLLVAIALRAGDPPAAPPEPPPIPGAPQAAPTPPVPTQSDGSGQSSAAPSAPAETQAPPRRLWVILDYYKEFGGTVLREDEASITLRTVTGEERTVNRNAVVAAIPLLDDPEGTRVIVRWRDGRTTPAELVSDGFEQVVVRLGRTRTTLSRQQILAVEREVPFEDRLASFRARIPAEAWDMRLELVRWILAQQHPEIAIEELREIRKHADSEEAADLMRRAELELALAKSAARREEKSPDAEKPAKDTGRPRLSDDDVNLIRVMEVDLKAPPRMHHRPDLAPTIAERYATDERLPAADERQQMRSWPTARLLQLLFALKARDLYDMVQVDEDPEHLRVFRKRVHDGWLIPNCATSRCHGGPAGGRLLLATEDPKSARTAYTNLLILLGYRNERGEPLVDFDAPEKSSLAAFGLPRSDPRCAHPPVAAWRPVSPSLQRDMESEVLAWLRGMHRPRHEYPVTLPAAAEKPPEPAEAR